MNRKELEQLEEKIEDTEKNFGETEQRDALMAKAEYLCRVGNKVSQQSRIPSPLVPELGYPALNGSISGCCCECISCCV